MREKWIAATALSANLSLVTADSDFQNVSDLVIEYLGYVNAES